jgi:hypothetical protein
MADAPWSCSQCGTVNEPVANACRTCGRWPSLFELEGSTIEAEPTETRAAVEEYEPEPLDLEPASVDVEVFDVGRPVEVETPVDPELENVDDEAPKPLWRRLASFIVPATIALYILINAIVNNDGG